MLDCTLDAGLLARSQYSEGPATGHLDTGFSWFPCVYKQMLKWFPRLQVATACSSCSPPDLNLVVTNFIFCIHVKQPLPPDDNPVAVNKYYYTRKFYSSEIYRACKSAYANYYYYYYYYYGWYEIVTSALILSEIILSNITTKFRVVVTVRILRNEQYFHAKVLGMFMLYNLVRYHVSSSHNPLMILSNRILNINFIL